MNLSLTHHLFSTSPPPPPPSSKSPFFKTKSNTRTQPPPSSRSCKITCKILINPSEKSFPRKNNKPPPPPPPPFPQPPEPPTIFSPTTIPPPHHNPFQKLAAAALDMVEKSIVTNMEKNHKLNRMVDPTVQLEGNYAPVQECPVHQDLEVVGTIPTSVRGAYLRNGGNPLFEPISGHHFFDGDGMIHAVTLAAPENRASYACRFTRTNRLLGEAALRKPVFPKQIGELHGHSGLARLALFAARALAGLVNAADGFGLANVNVVYFNGRILAMSEDDLPYTVRLTEAGDLETIGQYDFDGQVKGSMIAHPKVDPATGDLYTLSYNILSKPYLKFLKFDKWGNKSRELTISIEQPTMIHDFTMTESHVVIPDHQMVFKLSEMMRGGSPVIHDPNKMTRFGVLPKNAVDESEIRWIDVPECFCFHMWNAWEERDENGDKIIVVINSCMTPADSIFSGSDDLKSELSEIRLNLKTGGSTRRVVVSGMNLEAGQINKQQLGKKTRYVYLAIADPWPKCSGIARVDLETGEVTKYLYGPHRFGGEPCFVPVTAEEEDEEEGYLMSFVRDEENEKSEFVILKASTMEQVALVKLPKRVPYGFHGTFVSAQEIQRQCF
ncbi:hypothetical protein ABFS82_07G059000 [Erythranthe guttata]|uniref:9-cis-epoxycarotenoid dioxygenase n=1 Tax=Erythranthe guttata TaxID=4155 RepID=A0A022RXW1_ERYGU|nr:PREDICTED: 9-cis-epoxycarotenoid dioxygenase NCED6, chloroplastic [Erythranthe guttata]EYU43820.1 hypothetical protein MIMGU_mgv1a026010mg [Erythranthe guttata]|eukprot:XP_012829546.1 PREDICTED: 9-cis-epoxycarotenoid dioxygenase NCED6, chloroplastic [Erythranthe guttata]